MCCTVIINLDPEAIDMKWLRLLISTFSFSSILIMEGIPKKSNKIST